MDYFLYSADRLLLAVEGGEIDDGEGDHKRCGEGRGSGCTETRQRSYPVPNKLLAVLYVLFIVSYLKPSR
jgi:hypothetical protein